MSGDYLLGLIQGWGLGFAGCALLYAVQDWLWDRKEERDEEGNRG